MISIHSCALLNFYSSKKLIGKYTYNEKTNVGFSVNFRLDLYENDSFYIEYSHFERLDVYRGKWYLAKDTLYLDCIKEETSRYDDRGFWEGKTMTLQVISREKLLRGDVVLAKQK